MKHKAGFVNIIGNPNVGKSTLVNSIMQDTLAIATAKAQTTRHRILAMLNTDEYQVVFSDTPGIIKEPKYKLQEQMMRFVHTAFEDADILLYVIEQGQSIDPDTLKKIHDTRIPFLLIVNKIDTSDQTKLEQQIEDYALHVSKELIVPISALHHFNVDNLKQLIIDRLPESEAYFDKEEITDRPARFFVTEIIRENILNLFTKEIPYSVEVVCHAFKESETRLDIQCTIFTERESQRAILIGKGGQAIKRLGMSARKQLEKFFEQHIYLDLSIKVSKDWRKNDSSLKQFGYKED